MRINMSRWLIAIAPVLLIGCSPSTAEDELYGAGFIIVNEQTWGENHTSPYPFTVAGEISCGSHPEFGREVYFEPVGYTDESNIGTPLNKSAVDSLDRDNMKILVSRIKENNYKLISSEELNSHVTKFSGRISEKDHAPPTRISVLR